MQMGIHHPPPLMSSVKSLCMILLLSEDANLMLSLPPVKKLLEIVLVKQEVI